MEIKQLHSIPLTGYADDTFTPFHQNLNKNKFRFNRNHTNGLYNSYGLGIIRGTRGELEVIR